MFFFTNQIVIIIFILSAITIIQFYKGRKLNILIMKTILNQIENNLLIKDKLYTWLGGYVGFKANYEINSKFINKLEITLTLLSRQSLLWLPISYLLFRGDRLFIVIYPRIEIKFTFHFINKYYYLFGIDIDEKEKLIKENYDNNFDILYEKDTNYNKLLEIINNSFNTKNIRQIAFLKKTNSIYIFIKPNPNEVGNELNKFLSQIEKII